MHWKRECLPIFDNLIEDLQQYLLANKVKILEFKLKKEVIFVKDDYKRRRIRLVEYTANLLRPGLSSLLKQKEE
jgi:hypothetical protein